MNLEPFDVVIVPFPYSEQLAEKRRPALVVSTPEAIAGSGQIWVVMITSSRRSSFGDAAIHDLAGAGLTVACKLRAAKIATVEVSRILRRSGALALRDREGARAALRRCAAF